MRRGRRGSLTAVSVGLALGISLSGNAFAAGAVAEGFFSLDEIAACLGLGTPSEVDKRIVLKDAFGSPLIFEPNSRRACCRGVMVYLNYPVLLRGRSWVLYETDARMVVDPLWRPGRALTGQTCRMIVLDPGHGGNDRGTVGPGGLEEKRLTLDISRRVASRLSRCGFVVRLTRDRDRTVLLDERTRIAAGLRADVLISVHINSSPDFRVRGFETFVTASPGFPSTASSRRRRSDDVVHLNNRFDAQNVVLGYDVQRGLLCYAEGQDRGLKRARFQILRDARCPAALVECGFASNKTDRENLLSAAYRDTVADGIARGLMTYAVDVRRAP